MRPAVLLCLTACGRLGFDASSNAPPGDAAPDGPIDWTAWSTPVHVDSAATDQYDWEPALHPNNRVLVFARSDTTISTSDLFVTMRPAAGQFGLPTKLPFSQGSDFGGAWTPDGTQLYFTSSRTGSARLYISAFDGTNFSAPTQIPELVDEEAVSPTISATGLEMFYCDADEIDNKIRRAHRDTLTSPWVIDGVVTELDTPSTDGWPTLSPDGLVLLFESSRDNLGGFIYAATRTAVGEPFKDIRKVSALDDGIESGDPEISADGLTIFFAAERPGGNGLQDLYFAVRSF